MMKKALGAAVTFMCSVACFTFAAVAAGKIEEYGTPEAKTALLIVPIGTGIICTLGFIAQLLDK